MTKSHEGVLKILNPIIFNYFIESLWNPWQRKAKRKIHRSMAQRTSKFQTQTSRHHRSSGRSALT
jgi:hypothetical protein